MNFEPIIRVILALILLQIFGYCCASGNLKNNTKSGRNKDIDKIESDIRKKAKLVTYEMTIDDIVKILDKDIWGKKYKVFFQGEGYWPDAKSNCRIIVIYSGGKNRKIEHDYQKDDLQNQQVIGDDIRLEILICENGTKQAYVALYDHDQYYDNLW